MVCGVEEQSDLEEYLIKFVIDGCSKEQIKKDLRKDRIDLDWALYRKEDTIYEKLKKINEDVIGIY